MVTLQQEYCKIYQQRVTVKNYKACVFGNPIKQSKSPIIHSMFAQQFKINLDYQKRLAQPDGFATSARGFFADDVAIGANVTMPFKDDALKFASTLSIQAQRAGAVNTLIQTKSGIIGDNTDGYGLVTDLLEHNVELTGVKLLIIGAGGAVKGVLPALIEANVSHIDIFNRSIKKAQSLSDYTTQYAPGRTRVVMSDEFDSDYDLIINGTSLSLQSTLPEIPVRIFSSKPVVYDMVYLNEPTIFLKHALEQGCDVCIDGLGMLAHQAARSFDLWFNKKPEVDPVLEFLRQQL